MRKPDWTDYRQAMINNGYNDERAIESLVKKEFHLADIFSAQKEFQNKWENAAQVQKSVAGHHEELTKYLHHAVHDFLN